MLKYILRWWIMEENMLRVCREKRECEWVDEWVKAGKKNYLSNSEDTSISLTVCCETICVKKMGDLK